MGEVNDTNNDIIEIWAPQFMLDLRDAEARYNIKHNRNKAPLVPKFKFKKENGEIVRIGVNITKGLVMTHKGLGKYPDNRVAKPFFNETAEKSVSELADQIANNTGDMIAGHIYIN
jgi:hypothetical protein